MLGDGKGDMEGHKGRGKTQKGNGHGGLERRWREIRKKEKKGSPVSEVGGKELITL